MGNTTDLILVTINNGAFLLCVLFLAYVIVIIVPFVRRKPAQTGDSDDFRWHFIVPCLNEEAVIDRTVRRLVADFPEAYVWCVDDGSTDATPELLAALAARCKRVQVVTRLLPDAHKGKGAALNAAWRALEGCRPSYVDPAEVIVGVVDADGQLDTRCLETIAGPAFFGDPGVGAVQIQVRVLDLPARARRRFARLLVRLQDVEFTVVIAAMQTLRRHVGSVGLGGNGQFTRLSALNTIADQHGTPWHGALLEDFELGLHVLLVGERTEYCHDTWVAQEGLATLRTLIRQRSRWAQGAMQCTQYLRPVLRSPGISNFGAAEISYFLVLPWVQLIGGAIYVCATLVVLFYAFTAVGGPAQWFQSDGWGLLPLFVLFGLGPLVAWGPVYRTTRARGLSRTRAIALGLANWPYSYVHHVATWWAFIRVIRSRGDWKKTEREVDIRPVPAVLASVPASVAPPPIPTPTPAPTPLVVEPVAAPPRSTAAAVPPTEEDWDQAVIHPLPADASEGLVSR